MPQGYYTIEKWTGNGRDGKPKWGVVMDLPFGITQTAAEKVLEQSGKPGFFRLVQTQRVIWAEKQPAGLKLRKSHASSPQSLEGMRKMFERCKGKFPEEEVRQARRKMKLQNSSRR
jgi:hypothetical protein